MTREIALLLLCSWPASALAYGEVVDDRPSKEERAAHFFTDRLRVDPDFTDAQFSNYDAVRPLIYGAELNEAARFYADDMALNGCFPSDHSSCDGTSFVDRLAMFYPGQFIGENILWGLAAADAAVFEGWLYSPPHRDNMLRADWLELGTGFASERSHWVQDFGAREGVEEPIATSGTHWPLTGSSSGATTFFLAVHDPDGPVEGVDVFVDGSAHAMAVDRGPEGSRTFAAEAANDGDACRPYWFVVTRGDGAEVRYPNRGALLATVGGVSCEAWEDGEGLEAEGGGGDGLGSAGNGCSEGGGNAAGPDSNQTGGNVELGSCSLDGRRRPASGLLLCLLALGLRRRR